MNEHDPPTELTASLLESLRAGADAQVLPPSIDSVAFQEGIELLARVWLNDDYLRYEGQDLELSTTIGRFGRFEVRRLVGRGSFSAVFEAFDTTLQRLVALKIPRPEILANATLRARFILDAEMAANLQHPNIVPVFETNQLGPVCYTVAAFVDGPTMADWMTEQDRPIEPTIAAHLLRSIADATAYAHQHGILHRDIKPSNVLLDTSKVEPENPARYVPKLTDFGLAKEMNGDEKITQAGALIGTIAYMAPEQLAGKAAYVSARSDVYSLGIILFECLTRYRPFQGNSPSELQDLIEQSPTPNPRKVIPLLPEDLAAICSKCLEKDPRDRYLSADGLRDDLDRFLRGEPVHARPVSSVVRAYRWCRRKPLLASLTTAILLVTILGACGIVIQWRRAEHNAALIATEKEKADAHLAQAEKTLLDLAWVAEESALWSRVTDGHQLAVRDLVRRYHDGLVTQQEVASVAPEVRASALAILATSDSEAGRMQQALLHFQQSIELWRRVVREHPHEPQYGRALALAHFRYALHLARSGDGQRSLDSMNEGRGVFESIIPQIANDPDVLKEYAILLFELANSHYRAGNRDEARNVYESSLAAYDQLRKVEPTSLEFAVRWAQVARHLGNSIRRQDASRSLALFESSLATFEEVLQRSPEDVTTNLLLSETCRALGIYRLNHNIDGALDVFERGVGALHLALAKEPTNLTCIEALATLYREISTYHAKCGNPNERLAALSQARQLWERVDGTLDFNHATLFGYAMVCYDEALFAERSKRIEFANERFLQARGLFERLLAQRGMNPRARHALAHCLMIAGDQERGRGEITQARTTYRSALTHLDAIDRRQQTPESKQRRAAIEKRLAAIDSTP
jgi:serine/threonine protein kinase